MHFARTQYAYPCPSTGVTRYLSQAALQLALPQDARAVSIVPVAVSEHVQLQLALLQLALSGSAALLQLALLQDAFV